MLESVLPGCKGRLDSSEVFIIPFLPDPPGRHREHLHEHVTIPRVFTSVQQCEPTVLSHNLYYIGEKGGGYKEKSYRR